MSRRWRFALGSVLVLAAGVVAVLALAPHDQTRKATVAEALERFRRDGAATGRGADGPAPGVYRYRTRGAEHVDAAGLLAATHDYDGVSTIVLTYGACGMRERWEVLAERWSATEYCPSADESGLRSITEFREFFGTAKEASYRCRGSVAAGRGIGARFRHRCGGPDGSATSVSEVTAKADLMVDGKAIPAVRIDTRVALRGEIDGTTVRVDWRRRADGLLLRRVADTAARVSGAVGADYSEHYAMHLLSPVPER